VCVYYCSTYYKAVRVGGGATMEDRGPAHAWQAVACRCERQQDLRRAARRTRGGTLARSSCIRLSWQRGGASHSGSGRGSWTGRRPGSAPKTVVGHGQVEDQAPAARCVLEVAAELHVAAPLACACRYAVLRADRVSGRAEQRP
jgi:hypothetical protein